MSKNTDIYQIIGTNVRTIRKQKGLTQLELANKCAVDRSKISDIENGKENFMFSTLVNIAEGLDVSVRELLNNE